MLQAAYPVVRAPNIPQPSSTSRKGPSSDRRISPPKTSGCFLLLYSATRTQQVSAYCLQGRFACIAPSTVGLWAKRQDGARLQRGSMWDSPVRLLLRARLREDETVPGGRAGPVLDGPHQAGLPPLPLDLGLAGDRCAISCSTPNKQYHTRTPMV